MEVAENLLFFIPKESVPIPSPNSSVKYVTYRLRVRSEVHVLKAMAVNDVGGTLAQQRG